jgi:cysteine desulfurase/selenocysteine lyase
MGSPFAVEELAKMANAFFRAIPGQEADTPGVASAADILSGNAERAAASAAMSPAPHPRGGMGRSTSFPSAEGLYLASATAVGGDVLSLPGVSLVAPARGALTAPLLAETPLPTSRIIDEQNRLTSPQLPASRAIPNIDSAMGGVAPGMFAPVARVAGPELYIVSEAWSPSGGKAAVDPTSHAAASPRADWTTARSDLMPGFGDLDAVLGGIPVDTPAAPASDPAAPLGVSKGGYPAFDVEAVRRDFPILREKIHGRPLIWLDNGATTQKPQVVIDRLSYFYEHENSNIHRAAHTLAARATDAYENARKITARFLGAGSPDEIVFVRGSTEAINLVAQSWGRRHVGEGDEIIVSHLEHHANIVPWQQLAAEKGARIRVIPVDDTGQIRLDEYDRLLSDRTKIVAITHVSNALGTIVPIKDVIDLAHAAGAKVLIDGAQSVAHTRADVQALDADFFVFSGHKIFGPTGIGVLYGKRDLLNAMPPWQGGGNMIADVTFEKTVFQPAPAKFEAGTGNLADAVGLGAALEYVERIGLEAIQRYEHDLLVYATEGLKTVPGLKLYGTAPDKASVLSFLIDGFSPQEVGAELDRYGIAVRAGHHCAQPILRRFGVEGTVRASLALYNTRSDVDCLVSALRQISATRPSRRA